MRMRVRMCMAVLVRGIYCISTQTTTVATASTPIALPYSSTHLHDEGEEGNHGQAAVLELGERPVLADAVGGEAQGVEADVCGKKGVETRQPGEPELDSTPDASKQPARACSQLGPSHVPPGTRPSYLEVVTS